LPDIDFFIHLRRSLSPLLKCILICILEIIESNFKNARHTVNAIVIKSIFYLFKGFIKI
jgi:hypothetical protein